MAIKCISFQNFCAKKKKKKCKASHNPKISKDQSVKQVSGTYSKPDPNQKHHKKDQIISRRNKNQQFLESIPDMIEL